jgi:hypothetical protein
LGMEELTGSGHAPLSLALAWSSFAQ